MVIVCPEHFKMWEDRELRYCDHLNPIQWLVIKRPTCSTTSRQTDTTSGHTSTTSGQTSTTMDKRVLRMGKRVLQEGEDYYEWPGK